MQREARARAAGLARNPNAPTAMLLRLLDHRPTCFGVVLRAKAPDPVWDAIVAHPDPNIRAAFAESWNAPPDQRARLVEDPNPEVRASLAAGPDAFRQPIDPMPVRIHQQLAGDSSTRVRTSVAWSRHTPPVVRFGLLDDPDPAVRAAACTRCEHIPETVSRRLLADPDAGVRRAVRLHVYRQFPEVVDAIIADPGVSSWDLADVAADAVLAREHAEFLAGHSDASVRAGVAENPHLPADLVSVLAIDPQHRVRLAVSMRSDLDDADRAAIDWHIGPTDRIRPALWVRTQRDDLDVLRRCARSAHVGLRRSCAYSKHLIADLVAVLAADEDFAVRLLLCENHPDAPGDLLLATLLEADVITRFDLLRHRNFPLAGLARLADSPDRIARMIVVRDPDAPPHLIERLSHDPDDAVRVWMAGDPRLPPERILELLAAPETAEAAATNPGLPLEAMERIMTEAGLSDPDACSG